MNPTLEVVTTAIAKILRATRERDMIACIHTDGPETARARFAQGFQLCSLQNDVRLLSDGARAQVEAARRV